MLYVHQILVATDTLQTVTELQISPFFLIDSLMISSFVLNKRLQRLEMFEQAENILKFWPVTITLN